MIFRNSSKQVLTNAGYDQIADSYNVIYDQRKVYLSSINNLVIPYLNKKIVLDIGSGDGSRIADLYNTSNIKELFCLEPSNEMYKKLSKYEFIKAKMCTAQDYDSDFNNKFDVITSLWNVLGHVGTFEELNMSMINIRNYLKNNGLFIFDVNNRLNGSSYGMPVAIYRLFIDSLFFKRSRGDTNTKWDINGREIRAYGHVFSPFEVFNLLKKHQFKIIKTIYVNYNTGKLSKNFFDGQIFVIAQKKN